MSAQTDKLAVMSRQIADFFRPYPQEEAARSIADHINRFWTRKMRAQFLDSPDIRNGTSDPLLVAAAQFVRGG